jgi:hypothetical protein
MHFQCLWLKYGHLSINKNALHQNQNKIFDWQSLVVAALGLAFADWLEKQALLLLVTSRHIYSSHRSCLWLQSFFTNYVSNLAHRCQYISFFFCYLVLSMQHRTVATAVLIPHFRPPRQNFQGFRFSPFIWMVPLTSMPDFSFLLHLEVRYLYWTNLCTFTFIYII